MAFIADFPKGGKTGPKTDEPKVTVETKTEVKPEPKAKGRKPKA